VPEHFAKHGVEKMLYDVRMGPQAVFHEGVIYAVYPANPDGPEGHPHIREYDVARGSWSDEVQLGTVPHYDHHFAPIVWVDPTEHLHVLYGCHGRNGGTHLRSTTSRSIQEWESVPEVGKSVSYPRVLPLPEGRHLMYSRTFGHLGYWTFRLSEDGNAWTETEPLIDFDQIPKERKDVWACTYQSVAVDAEGTGLHIGFVTFDEQAGVRKRPNPLYGRYVSHYSRHNLYYVHVDIDTRRVTTVDGEELPKPITRSVAERCKLLDTGLRATNPPSVVDDGSGNPMMMLPYAGEASPWEGEHVFVRRENDAWAFTSVASLNNTWSGNWLIPGPDGLNALLTRGEADGELLSYGGGRVERWRSGDGGQTWAKEADWEPCEGLICNNPRPVPTSRGGILDGYYTQFGWEGPNSLAVASGKQLRDNGGYAFLHLEGEWLGL